MWGNISKFLLQWGFYSGRHVVCKEEYVNYKFKLILDIDHIVVNIGTY